MKKHINNEEIEQVIKLDISTSNSKLSEYNVTMSNALVRASHALTLFEKRVIATAIAKTDSRKGNAKHAHLAEFQNLRLSALDFAEAYNIDPKHAYTELRKAAQHLFKRYIRLSYKDDDEDVFRWISSCKYRKSKGFIELSFTPEIYPHLHELKWKYTTYKLKNAAALRSMYSWRLFELAQSWISHCKKGKTVQLHLADVRHSLEVPKSYKWHDFKKRALDPSIREIKNHANVDITYTVIKQGRKVHSLDFFFKEQDQLELPL
jgi:plasmid replication initiation protein